jgi:hypothetical protein
MNAAAQTIALAEIRRYTATVATEEMRQRAAAEEWQAVLLEGQGPACRRRAAQGYYEAALWVACYDAEEVLDAEMARRPGLDAAVEGAEAAEKQAREQLARAVAHETRAAGALERARADDSCVPERRSAVAVSHAEAARTAAEARSRHDAAERALTAARAAVTAHQQDAQKLQTAYDAAGRLAENPGVAPVAAAEKTIRIHATVAEMSALERDWVKHAYGELVGVYDRPSSAQPAPRPHSASGPDWRADAARRDPSKPLIIRQGDHVNIIPAAVPAAGR